MSSPSQGRQAEKTFESGCVFPCIPISSCSWWGSGERHPDSATDTLPRRKNSYFRLEPGRATTPHIAFMRTLWWQMTNNPENSNLGKPPEFEVTHLCLTLCDPLDYSLPGSSVHGISQARILEWFAISFSRGSSQPRDQTQVSSTEANSLAAEPALSPQGELQVRVDPGNQGMTSRIHLSSLWVLFSYLLTASLLLAATHLHLEQSGHKGTFFPSNSSKTLGTQSFLTLTDQVNSHSYPSALLLSSGSRALAAFLGPVTGPLPSTPKPVEAGGWLDLKEALRMGTSEPVVEAVLCDPPGPIPLPLGMQKGALLSPLVLGWPKVHSGFIIRCYGKPQKNFLLPNSWM